MRRPEQPLDPFLLAKYAKLLVVPYEQIEPSLTEETKRHLIGEGKDMWSGGAASQPLPDGRKLIILNPTHGRNRHKATLMEEVCHVFLGHKASRLAVKRKDKKGNIVARDYNHDIEEEAYSTGAAALVPYIALKQYVEEGQTSAAISRHFGVSRALVEFRIKISKLWDTYKRNVASNK